MRRFLIAFAILAALPISVSAASSRAYAAALTQGVDRVQMTAGTTQTVTLKFRNGGSYAWKNSGKGYVSLYASNPARRRSAFYGSGWRTRSQAALLKEASVKPGGTGTITVTLHAPDKSGTYVEPFQLASENVAWVWGGTARLTIDVAEPTITAMTPIHAQAWIAMDADTGAVLAGTNTDQVRSIASLTKLTSVLVTEDQNLDPNQVVVMQRADEVGGGRLRMRYGTPLTVTSLLASTLVASANNSANALARATGLPKDAFVAKMNDKAASLGLTSTHFTDPTGIESTNVSTAAELGKIAFVAFNDPTIRSFVSQPTYHIAAVDNRAAHDITNTNKLLKDPTIESLAGKTGFNYEAGYCLATIVQKEGAKPLLVVVLGSDTSNQQFRDAKAVAERVWSQQ